MLFCCKKHSHSTVGNGLDRSAILPPLKGEVDFARRAKDERVLNAFQKGLASPESGGGKTAGFDGRVEQAPFDKGDLFTAGASPRPTVKW